MQSHKLMLVLVAMSAPWSAPASGAVSKTNQQIIYCCDHHPKHCGTRDALLGLTEAHGCKGWKVEPR